MQFKKNKLFFSAILLVVCFSACSVTRRLGENKYLLVSNSLRTSNTRISISDITSLIKQKPNRKILGVLRFHLRVYNLANRGKENRIKRWMKNTIGEEPVILDTNLANRSALQIQKYLVNKGYFHAQVRDTTIYMRNKKAREIYILNTGKPYTIRKINYVIEDSAISKIYFKSVIKESFIKVGSNYDADELQNERELITKALKDDGYYGFVRDYIYFNVDSSFKSSQVDITLGVKNPEIHFKSKLDSTLKINHILYYVKNISIDMDYNPLNKDVGINDTLKLFSYNFLHHSGFYKFRPRAISRAIFSKKGDLYQFTKFDKTYKRFSELHNFRYINIEFTELPWDTLEVIRSTRAYLNNYITLTPLPLQSYSFEAEGTNSAGNLGMAGNLIYQHNNIFKGFEILNLKLKGGMEFQQITSSKDQKELVKPYLPFNTYEYGFEANLSIPRYLLPVNQEKFSKNNLPKTTINAGFNLQQRPDYWRTITNVALGYEWKETTEKRHTVYPIDGNVVRIDKDSSFTAKLYQLNDKKIINSYLDHFTAATRYTYIYIDQKTNARTDYSFFRYNFETAGLLLQQFCDIKNVPKNPDRSYSLFNIKFAQYVRSDIDFRHYFYLNKHSMAAFKTIAGFGIPYGNSKILPFEKSFYAGGANSVRAWKIFTLGPGSFRDSNIVVDKRADIDFEINLEYRYDIYKVLKGAIFMDAGNIWFANKDETRPGSDFQFNRFYKEIGMGAGIGARLDFSFFVFRLDAAMPLYDPAYPEGDRWTFDRLKHKYFFDFKTDPKIVFNLGIGYPF